MTSLLGQVGFVDLHEDRRTHNFVVSSEDEYLEAMLQGTPMGHSLREETPDIQAKVIEKTRRNLQSWRTSRGFELPCECVLVTGRK